MTQPERSDPGNPFAGVILVLIMALGAIWVQPAPLPSSRPPGAVVTPDRYAAQQDVDARLWQDPFEAIKRAAPKPELVIEAVALPSRGGKGEVRIQGALETPSKPLPANPVKQQEVCGGVPVDGRVLVLAVMVNGAPYAEAAEDRRRTRYAVVSGLGRGEYVPMDREHIGLMTADVKEPSGKSQSVGIPFEWFLHPKRPAALVLWINETQIRYAPLHGVEQIVRKACSCVQNRETVLIGPGNSDVLLAMVKEKVDSFDEPLHGFLQELRIYSPRATVPDEYLLDGLSGAAICGDLPDCRETDRTVKHALMSKAQGLQFHRTNSSDRALAVALVGELERRGVEPDDGIVLISEWDTSYGRALPDAFEEIIKSNRTKWIDPPKEPLWRYSYLRGLDGMLPGEGEDKRAEEGKKAREKEGSAIEPAFGNHQKDYLRQIAGRVADLDQRLKRDNKAKGVKAIGILGSDIYDKLLVLRALRPRFPAAIFFTTDLDARLLHAEERTTARNLVVASGYGLRLNGWLQKEIPPFRDSYQTAYFLSVQAALMEKDHQNEAMKIVDAWSWGPRIFEVGRNQAVDLSVTVEDDGPCNLATCKSPHPSVKLPRPPGQILIAWLALLSLLGGWYLHRHGVVDALREARDDIHTTLRQPGHWYSQARYLGFRPATRPNHWYSQVARVLACKWVLMPLLAVLLVLWLGWQGYRIWSEIFIVGTANGSEPFSWSEGVSIWPSVMLRFCAGILALYLLLRGMQRLRTSDEKLTCDFFRGHVLTVLERRRPSLGVRLWHALARGRIRRSVLSGRFWSWFKGEQRQYRQAVFIWRDAVQPRSRIALLGRMLMDAVLVLATAMLIWNLLPNELPNTPYRGDLSNAVNRCILIFAILCFVFLLVFVIDSILRTCRLAARLSMHTSWPESTLRQFGCNDAQCCDDWLDIQFIAARTEVVGGFIYYPFLILSLIILARSSFFDNWQIPVGLGLIFVFYLVITLACAMSLRHFAESARRHALENIGRNILMALGKEECKVKIEQMNHMKEAILAEHRGAFSSFLHQPWIKAILLPLGSYSGVHLLESLSLLSL